MPAASQCPAAVYVATSRIGRGLFVGEAVPEGALLVRLTGPLLTLPDVRRKGAAAANALQVGVDRYLDLDEPGRYANHSCEPNAAVFEDVFLRALRPLAAGEEILFDYSTTVSDGWTMPCACGSRGCRGLIVAFPLLPRDLQTRYRILGCVQAFIVREVGG